MNKTMSNQKGFSLIELMIVVAIIGILSAIAIPNYQRFQMKARQSEAKSLLSGLYTSEKSFMAEHGQYFGDFRDIGFAPEGTLRYVVGFAGAGNAAPPAPYVGVTAAAGAATQFQSILYCAGAGAGLCTSTLALSQIAAFANAGAGNCAAGTDSAAAAFNATAMSDLDGGGNIDTWTINQGKNLCNNVDDVNT